MSLFLFKKPIIIDGYVFTKGEHEVSPAKQKSWYFKANLKDKAIVPYEETLQKTIKLSEVDKAFVESRTPGKEPEPSKIVEQIDPLAEVQPEVQPVVEAPQLSQEQVEEHEEVKGD